AEGGGAAGRGRVPEGDGGHRGRPDAAGLDPGGAGRHRRGRRRRRRRRRLRGAAARRGPAAGGPADHRGLRGRAGRARRGRGRGARVRHHGGHRGRRDAVDAAAGDAAPLPDPAVLPAAGDHPRARTGRGRPRVLPHRRLRRGDALPARRTGAHRAGQRAQHPGHLPSGPNARRGTAQLRTACLTRVRPNSQIRPLPLLASSSTSPNASVNSFTSVSPIISGGISLITSMWSPDTWVRIRCRWNSATTTIWANSPTLAFWSMFQLVLARSEDGLSNSRPIISPRPRTSASTSYFCARLVRPAFSASPVLAAFSVRCSSSWTWRAARPAVMASTPPLNVVLCTMTRSMLEKTFSKIGPLASIAPTGTNPPDSALA